MIDSKGFLQGPYIDLYSTSSPINENTSIFYNRTDTLTQRNEGIFDFEIFHNLPLKPTQTLYVCVKSLQIDNCITNYLSTDDGAIYERNNEIIIQHARGSYKVDDVPSYLNLLFNMPKRREKIFFDNDIKKVRISLSAGESMSFSKKTQQLLGLNKETYIGPCAELMHTTPDLYYSFRPLYLLCDIVTPSFIENRMQNVLARLNCNDQLKPSANDNRVLCFEFERPHWHRLDSLPGEYISTRVVDSSGKPVSFLPMTKSTIHLIIRSSDFDII